MTAQVASYVACAIIALSDPELLITLVTFWHDDHAPANVSRLLADFARLLADNCQRIVDPGGAEKQDRARGRRIYELDIWSGGGVVNDLLDNDVVILLVLSVAAAHVVYWADCRTDSATQENKPEIHGYHTECG